MALGSGGRDGFLEDHRRDKTAPPAGPAAICAGAGKLVELRYVARSDTLAGIYRCESVNQGFQLNVVQYGPDSARADWGNAYIFSYYDLDADPGVEHLDDWVMGY